MTLAYGTRHGMTASLADMLIKGEGAPADPKRAVVLLSSNLAPGDTNYIGCFQVVSMAGNVPKINFVLTLATAA